MKKTIINFNLHQPLRLSPDRTSFLWDSKNKKQFLDSSKKFYEPTLDFLGNLLSKESSFKFNLGMSGTFIEQAKEYSPNLLNSLKDVVVQGNGSNQLELLGETYYDSVAEFFKNPSEFNRQVSKHRDLLKQEFDITPTSYKHTKRPFNNFIANQLRQNNFSVMLSDIRDDSFKKSAYNLNGDDNGFLILKRNVEFSHLFSRGMVKDPVNYLSILREGVDPIVLSYAIGRVGNSSFNDFWSNLVESSKGYLDFNLARNIYSKQEISGLDEINISRNQALSNGDWKNAKHITNDLITTKTEFELFKQIEHLFEFPASALSREDKHRRDVLTSYANFRFLRGDDDSPDIRSNPYGNAIDATYFFTRKVDDLENVLNKNTIKFEILKRRKKDIILNESPEFARISPSIAHQGAVPINTFGGMAIVASSIANYLAEQGFDSRILTLDLTQNYDVRARDEYRQKIAADMNVHEDKIYLVRSFAFESIKNPYDKVPNEFLASEAQNYKMKYVFPKLLNENRSIIDVYHDQIFGGVSSAEFKQIKLSLKKLKDPRILKNVQYSHNIHDVLLNIEDFKDLPEETKQNHLFYSNGKIASLLTGIKNADGVFMVSEQWLREVKERYFPNRVPEDFAREIDIQASFGKVYAFLNGLPRDRYPEFAESLKHPDLYFKNADKKTLSLINSFGPDSNILEAKLKNKSAFQRLVGLNEDPNALLAVYSGRFDFYQKQCHILTEIIPHLQNNLKEQGINMQFAYISNPVEDIDVLSAYRAVGGQTMNSNGSISLSPFTLELELLGNAGADVAVGTSYIEMCGLNDALALMHGAIPAFTATGGIIDKLINYSVAGFKGDYSTHGNGVLFNSDHDSIWHGLKRAFELADYLQKRPELNRELMYTRMVDARDKLSVDRQGELFVKYLSDIMGRQLQ
ncbi:MAG: glycogen/starch synthase [Candidatus Woesearchaeota archaeon]